MNKAADGSDTLSGPATASGNGFTPTVTAGFSDLLPDAILDVASLVPGLVAGAETLTIMPQDTSGSGYSASLPTETMIFLKNAAPCYCPGTLILTDRGEVPVEALAKGDLVVTASGAVRPVRWLGHRRLDPHRTRVPADAHPIRIQAGALAEGVPHRDLLLSPGHHLAFEGALVKAGALVNGASIAQELGDTVDYWHVELDRHDILLANGAAAESYQDVGNRAGFESGAETVLDGEEPGACLPFTPPPAGLRAHLIARAEALGWQRATDPAPWLEAHGQCIGARRRGERLRFTLPEGCTEVELRSRTARPRDVDPASEDGRHLGLCLGRLALCGVDGLWWEVPLEHPLLAEGFWDLERDAAGWMWRWTDGDALLYLARLAPGRAVNAVEVTLDHELQIWIAPVVTSED